MTTFWPEVGPWTGGAHSSVACISASCSAAPVGNLGVGTTERPISIFPQAHTLLGDQRCALLSRAGRLRNRRHMAQVAVLSPNLCGGLPDAYGEPHT